MIHKTTVFLALLTLALSFCGCESNDPDWVSFNITFKAVYDGQPLEADKNYTYGNRTINFSRFSAYLSGISVYDGNESQSISEIEYIDFMAGGPNGVKKNFNAPPGNYKGLQIGFGVAPNLNNRKPADFPATHPLKENEYWIGWKSYIFTKVEGNYDTDGDGALESPITQHTGANEVYYEAKLLHDFTVEPNGDITVEFDLKKLFTFDGVLLDLSLVDNRVTSHTPSNLALGKKMIGNLNKAGILK